MVEKPIVLITGANQGLGYYAAQQLLATGRYHVLIGGRDLSKAQKAIETLGSDGARSQDVEAIQIDITSDSSITAAAETVRQIHGRLDILVLNAGISGAPGSLREQYTHVFDTNTFGAAVTVDTFLPLLHNSTVRGGKRIAFVSSGLASLSLSLSETGLFSGKNFPVYRASKTALNMLMVHYAKLLQDEGFVVAAADPGYCSTNLNGNRGEKDPRDGAKVILKAVLEDKDEVHGKMSNEDGPEPW